MDVAVYSCFEKRLSNKSIKAYATILKGIIGCGACSSLFHRQVHKALWILSFY